MAKTTKRVKQSKPASRGTASKARARKTSARKATARRRPRKSAKSRYSALAELLPTPVSELEYVSRTLKALEQDQLRRARSRATRAKQLNQIVSDMQHDLTSRIDAVEQTAVETYEGLAERVKANGVVQHAAQLPGQVSEQVAVQVTLTMDELLDRVGLVRKAVHQEAIRALPAPKRSRKAA